MSINNISGISKNRLFGLDLIRSIAILLVLFAHTITLISTSPIFLAVRNNSGLMGVELFFVLSGFLIGMILIKENEQYKYKELKGTGKFWVRRWFRTLPNYYIVLMYYNLVYYWSYHRFIFSFSSNTGYLFFCQNLFTEMPDRVFQVSWSLGIEEWFYLLFPLMIYLIQFIVKEKRKALFIVILLFIAVPLLLRIICVFSRAHISFDDGYRKIIPLRLDSIGYGVLLSYVRFYKPYLLTNYKMLFVFGLVVCSGALIFNSFYYNYFSEIFFFPLISIGIFLLIPFFEKIKKPGKLIVSGITFISVISYSLYLLHLLVILLVPIILEKFHFIFSPYIVMFIVWVITFFISYVQYTFFEKKITALRELF